MAPSFLKLITRPPPRPHPITQKYHRHHDRPQKGGESRPKRGGQGAGAASTRHSKTQNPPVCKTGMLLQAWGNLTTYFVFLRGL
jgi:hypothetical protein